MSPRRSWSLSDRHPFEIYLLVWAFVSSLPAAIGLTPLPPTILRSVDPWQGRTWVVSLTLGCLVALIGLGWRRRSTATGFRLSVTGLVLEQVGLVTVAAATVFYAGAASLRGGPGALPLAGIILGFGTACAAQAWKIQRVLKASTQ